MLRLSLSVCAYDRILKVSRKIADLGELRGDPIRSRGRSRWITLRTALIGREQAEGESVDAAGENQ